MNEILYIDIAKSGKSGMQWGKHKYIARIMLPNGHYEYVRPDGDEGHFDPVDEVMTDAAGNVVIDPKTKKPKRRTKFLFRLAQGKSLSGIINRHVWGGFDGEYTKHGEPKAPDGFFRTYAVVPNSELKMAKEGMQTREDVRDAILRRKGKVFKDAIKTEKVGDYTIFTFPKVPVVGQTAEGKKRYGGYIDISWNDSVTGKYKYKPTNELSAHHVTEPEDIEAATRFHATIKEGGGSGDESTMQGTSSPGKNARFKNPPLPTSAETSKVLGVDITDESDPLAIAKILRDRIYARKVSKQNKGKVGGNVAPGQNLKLTLPPEWIERYGSEDRLLTAIKDKPATVLVSLGLQKPTPLVMKRIEEEWRHAVVRGARLGWQASSYTKLYEKYKQMDEAEGLDATDPNSRVRKLKSNIHHDLIQEGYSHIDAVVRGYDPSKVGRLDTYLSTTLTNHLNNLSMKWAREQGLTHEMPEDHNVEEAANKMRQNAPFTPEEGAELNKLTPVALTAISRVLNTEHFPDTLRKVIVARLYLNDERVEAAAIGEHERLEADKREKFGDKYKREPRKIERDWEDVAHKLKTVVDPKTGESVDLTELPTSTRNRKLLTWFSEGIDKIRRDLSVGARPHDLASVAKREKLAEKIGVEHRPAWHHVEVEADPTDYTPEEKIYHTAIGDKKKVIRLLTPEGQAVKRYFELEAKLSGAARSMHGLQREELAAEAYPSVTAHEVDVHMRVKQKPELFKPHKTGPVKHVLLIPSGDGGSTLRTMSPAIGFFTASNNQHLARKLGVNLKTLEAGGGAGGAVWHQPNVSLGSKAQRTLNTVEQHYKDLQSYHKASSAKLKHATKVNSAAVKTLQALGQWTPSAKTRTSEWTEGDRGLSKLHDAATAYQSAVNVVAGKEARRAKIRRDHKEAQAAIGHLEEQVSLNKNTLKYKLNQHQTTEQEHKAVADAKKRYDREFAHVASVAPAVADLYNDALSTGKFALEATATLHTARARVTQKYNEHRNQQALIDFENERRVALAGMKKSWVLADELVAAIYEYDFELGRLDAAMEAA